MALRDIERASIETFVAGCSDYLTGNVLDFGCGKQPYKPIVDRAGGSYHPYDRRHFPANVSGGDLGASGDDPLLARYDAILCTQVIQYIPDVPGLLRSFHQLLAPDGFLVLTGPTNWPIVEQADLHRFTPTGIRELLDAAGFHFLQLKERAAVQFEGEQWSLGWGVLARTERT